MNTKFAKDLNDLARRYGNKKKRLYALKPAVIRKPISGFVGSSEFSKEPTV